MTLLRLAQTFAVLIAVSIGIPNVIQNWQGTAMAAPIDSIRSHNWVTVNDTVMGGVSQAKLGWNNKNQLVWTGNLSLANNGGFVSIRTVDSRFDWSAYDGLDIRLEGAGRDVQLSLQRTDMIVRAGGYRAPIATEKTGDTTVFVPFSAFMLKRFGRHINGPPLTEGLGRVARLGLLIADKTPGPFRVVLKSVTPVKAPKGKLHMAKIRSAISEAIEKGVPMFNSGDPKGCADLYRTTLEALLTNRNLAAGTWSHRLVSRAVDKSKRQPPVSAAWTLRYAMDNLFQRTTTQ